MRGILFDQPHVVARADTVLEAAGVADRCQILGGSFFEAVPEGGEAYLLQHILHDWEDEEATAILRTCRQAMTGPSTLLVIEREMPPANEGMLTKFSDLNMLVAPGGQERTAEEYAALFTAAGFQFLGARPTTGPWSIFEGLPA